MTNHYIVPTNLTELRKMFRAIQQRVEEKPVTYNIKQKLIIRHSGGLGTSEEKFTVSFFDGVKRISCQMYWDDLAKAIDFNDNKLKFERKSSVQQIYDTFLEKMKKEGKSTYEHILYNEMKIDGKDSIGEENKFTICKNKYPYDFGNHTHFLLWIHPDCDEITKSQIFNKDTCYEKVKSIAKSHKDLLGDRFIIFRNASINKSVHTIEHFHVIVY